MGLISDFLFGRHITIENERIGRLKARVKGDNPSINCTWTSEHQLAGQARPTVFILEGNNKGPHKEQLDSIYKIIDTLNDIVVQVDKRLKTKSDIKERYRRDWTKEFFLSAIYAYDPFTKGIERQFEVNFEPITGEDTDYITMIWDKGRLTEIEAK